MAHLAPRDTRHRLSAKDARQIDAARLAIRLHQPLSVVEQMSMKEFGTLADVMRADDEIAKLEAHRAAQKNRGRPPSRRRR